MWIEFSGQRSLERSKRCPLNNKHEDLEMTEKSSLMFGTIVYILYNRKAP